MTDLEMRSQLVWRFAKAQRPFGRWWLKVYVLGKSFAWRLVVGSARVAKRALDIVGSALALVLLSPLFLLVALLIKLEDRGPVFLAQTRVGRCGREFKMFKFRSTLVNTDDYAALLLAQDKPSAGGPFRLRRDPRITTVGRWLRKLSLDEFPQFCNVLRGEMALIGPRPCLPREVALYTLERRRQLEIKPGLTCFWQFDGRVETDSSRPVQLDVRYIESQSIWGDLAILLKAVPAVILGEGAY